MQSLMLLNPAKRPSKRKKPRSAAQKAATRRMLAARSHNPAKRRTRRKSTAVAHSSHARVAHAVRRHRLGRRRNPAGRDMISGISGMFIDGLKGAGGAVVVNAVVSLPFVPAMLKQGNAQYLTRAALALLLGTVGTKVMGNTARTMAEGSLVVTFHDLANSFLGTMIPGGNLHGVGEYMSGIPYQGQLDTNLDTRQFVDSELHGMSEYMS